MVDSSHDEQLAGRLDALQSDVERVSRQLEAMKLPPGTPSPDGKDKTEPDFDPDKSTEAPREYRVFDQPSDDEDKPADS